ncbi:MAG: fibronectin type III domain-containing protein [Terriglobia bacterium]
MPPTPKIPQPATGLVARQVGERVLLRWTLPRLHTDGTRLEGPPRLEVHRAFLPAPPAGEEEFEAAAQVAYVIPTQLVPTFLRNEIVVFPDLLGAETLRREAGGQAVYGIKTLNDKGQSIGFSNLVAVRVYPVPRPIAGITFDVTERAIELRWSPPTRTTSGTPLEAVAGYEIYRSPSGEEGSFALHGTSATARYRDEQFRFGGDYFYRIRTLAQFGADTVESASSVTVEVRPRDVFPPPAPVNLIAIVGPGRIDLTWDASAATDLAGYYVYRSRQAGAGYKRLNPQPLVAQSFSDTPVEPGTRYFYVVAAVDAEGNESPFSAEAAATPLAQD